MTEAPRQIDLALLDWSVVSSLGEDMGSSYALWQAGLCHLEASRFVDNQGQPLQMCLSPSIAGDVDGVERLIRLAAPALEALAARLEAPSTVARLVLGVPDWLDQVGLEDFVKGLQASCGLARVPMIPVQAGRASGATALGAALRYIDHGHLVVWGGVDTWHHWPVLQALLAEDRCLTDDQVDALRPGEAAAFVLLGAPRAQHVRCVGLGIAREPYPRGHVGRSRGDGLVQAVRQATASLRARGAPCRTWYLDSTHEAYATRELQFVIARCADLIADGAQMDQPLHAFGDVGAASMPLLGALAAQAAMDNATPQAFALVTGSSDDGRRGAMLLSTPPRQPWVFQP